MVWHSMQTVSFFFIPSSKLRGVAHPAFLAHNNLMPIYLVWLTAERIAELQDLYVREQSGRGGVSSTYVLVLKRLSLQLHFS